jgi:hypothetical protein
MRRPARAYRAQELAHDAYRPYGRFRPSIPEGVRGWGTRGGLDRGRSGGWAVGLIVGKG